MSEPYRWAQVNARRGEREPFAGLDYQGRYDAREDYAVVRAQQAAEAATEIGADEPSAYSDWAGTWWGLGALAITAAWVVFLVWALIEWRLK